MEVFVKRCFKCGKWKPIDEFYRHPEMADGHLGKCKECTKRDNIENRQRKIDYYRSYDRRRFQKPRRRSLAYAQSRLQRIIHPLRYYARTAVGNALRDGRLVRQPCKICGNPESEAHHPDYSKPLEVVWLCKACHAAEHQKSKEKQDVIAV